LYKLTISVPVQVILQLSDLFVVERFLTGPPFLMGPEIFSLGPEPAFGSPASVGVGVLNAVANGEFSTLNMVAAYSFEAYVLISQTTWHNIS